LKTRTFNLKDGCVLQVTRLDNPEVKRRYRLLMPTTYYPGVGPPGGCYELMEEVASSNSVEELRKELENYRG